MYVFSLLFVCLCISIFPSATTQNGLDNAKQYFEDFIQKYDKHYSEHEKKIRFEIFKENLEEMKRLNNGDDDGLYGINQFSDLLPDEFIKSHTGYHRRNKYLRTDDDEELCENVFYDIDVPDVDVPDSFDWRYKNAVTPVKNQNDCGSCWAFATAALLESQYAIKYNKQIDLSEQQIIDCDQLSNGCCGGLPSYALAALKEVGGVMLETDYQYQYDYESKNRCRVEKKLTVVKVANCSSYILRSQEKVKQLLYQTGPLLIGINAEPLQHYTSSKTIMTDEICHLRGINHVVLLVGYGTENDKPYWIAKNSWGTTVEEDGYFRMERSENYYGACGMMTTALLTAVIE